jgi:ABC-type phosphate transport system substrate-binding protein
MVGNTIVLKPASVTMGCAIEIEKVFNKSGLPDGVFQTIVGDSSIVDILIDSQDVNAVTWGDTGTTYVWTSYLSSASPSWNQTIGASKSVPWPTGIGAPGNKGVTYAIRRSPNTIGYVELNYALTTGIPYALVKNPTGNFIEPSLSSTQEAVSNAVALNSLPAGDKSWTRQAFYPSIINNV